MNQKASCLGLSIVDANTGYLLRSSVGGLVLHTLQAGGVWDAGTNVTIGTLTGTDIADMHFVDATTGYVVAGGSVFKTTNSGATWSGTTITVTGGQTKFSTRYVDFGSKTNGVVAGLYGTIVATSSFAASTTDGGATWTEIVLPTDAKGITAVGMAGPGTIVLGGVDGPAKAAIFTTTNGGTSWTTRKIAAKGVADIDFLTDKLGFVVSYPAKGPATTNEQILSTNDGAGTWNSPFSGVVPVQILSAAWVDKDNGFVGGRSDDNSKLAIARTTNGGAAWTLETMPVNGTEFEKPSDLMDCMDYPGPAAYAGTTNGMVSMIKNGVAGGTRPVRYTGGGTPAIDAGPNAADAGPNAADAGPNAADGGNTGVGDDAGGNGGGGGGGCSIASSSPIGGWGFLLLAMTFLFRRRSNRLV